MTISKSKGTSLVAFDLKVRSLISFVPKILLLHGLPPLDVDEMIYSTDLDQNDTQFCAVALLCDS